METKPNRAWVKDAAIVFLVILLVLTFFSNTIMNHSLPEVATQMVSNGTITAKVRGTGTVTAVGTHKVKATESITIGRVLVKSGQEVNAGDVLFVLGAADSTKLEEAYATLEDLQASYAQQAASSPILSQYTEERNAVDQAWQDYQDALEAYNVATKADEKSDKVLTDLLTEKSKTEAALTTATQELDEEKLELNSVDAALTAAKNTYTTLYTQYLQQNNTAAASAENSDVSAINEISDTVETTSPATTEAPTPVPTETVKTVTWEEVEQAKQKVEELEQQKSKIEQEKGQDISNKQYEVDTLTKKLAAINAQLATYSSDTDSLKRAVDAAEDIYNAKVDALNSKLAAQNQSVSASSASLTAISNKIKRQQEKIKKLSGEGDSNTITANVSGTVTEVNCTAGDSMIKDDILCAIEVPDQGYTVSFSVMNDKAKRLHVGDTATISNYYWGNEIVATLSSIQTDKKKPMTNKTLTFNLEGDVTSGSELTISVGQKSANYDIIIPNSAIRSDSNGSFVLAVTAKNSPLGNRYIAKRVKIEVLAQDDNNAAVTADLSNGDYVITTSSAPISSGDMVRLADSEK